MVSGFRHCAPEPLIAGSGRWAASSASGTRVAAPQGRLAPAGPQPLEDALARGELVLALARLLEERKESPGGRRPGLLDAPCDPGRRILGDPLRLGADVGHGRPRVNGFARREERRFLLASGLLALPEPPGCES